MAFMTCPGREDYARELSSWLPEAQVFFDTQKNATLNFLNMLAGLGDDAGLLMEDDILLTDNFRFKVKEEVRRKGNTMINFFAMNRKDDRLIGSRYIPGRQFNSNCCVWYPPGYAARILDFYEKWPRREKELKGHGFDYLVADFLDSQGLVYWARVPALVQHRVGVSAIDPRRPRNRIARLFDGDKNE
jgi:hypothetical protein